MNLIFLHLRWEMLFSLLVAAYIARVAIPSIVRVARMKGLVAKTNGRTSHEGCVPYLGGISIFTSLIISSSLFVVDGFNHEFQYIIPAIIIIFFIGLKDDVANLSARTKMIAQLLASIIIIVMADVRINTFHGLFGVYELPLYVSYGFTLIVFVALINAFNLIDGIDGLASGLGIQISLVFGFWLAFLQRYDYAVLSFALTGGLLPFYYFNVFGQKYKLFMGDTGSLLIGLIFSVLAVKILCCELPHESLLYAEGVPVLVASVMIIPIADTIRVFAMRIMKGRSPLSADKNHFHHYLLRFGMNHWQASTLVVAINFALFIVAFIFREWGDVRLGILIFGLAFVVTSLPWLVLSLRERSSTLNQRKSAKRSLPTQG